MKTKAIKDIQYMLNSDLPVQAWFEGNLSFDLKSIKENEVTGQIEITLTADIEKIENNVINEVMHVYFIEDQDSMTAQKQLK